MYKRKKFHGGLKQLLLPLFIMLLGLFSTSYAVTNIPQDKANYIIEHSFKYDTTEMLYPNLWYSNDLNYRLRAQINLDNFKTTFRNAFNSNNTLDFRDDFNNFLGYWACYRQGNNYQLWFFYTNTVNYGKFGDNNHVYLKFGTNYNNDLRLAIYFIDDNKNIVRVPMARMSFIFSNNTITFNTYSIGESLASGNDACFSQLGKSNWNYDNLNNSRLESLQGVINFFDTDSVYTNFDGVNYYNIPIVKFLTTDYVGSNINPDNPNNPDTNTSGTITNPSGEITGQIDLSNIENGIDNINNNLENINQNMPTSGDIAQATINANTNYWGNNNSLSGEQQEQEIENNLNSIIDNISGELSQNEIMQELERSRSRLFKLF